MVTKTIDKALFFERLGYEPFPEQKLYHNSKARFRIPVCGRRFGKSLMAARDLEPDLFVPHSRHWIVGPTYDLAEKEFRVIWDDLIVKQGFGKDKRIKKAYNKRAGEMYINFTPWNTVLEVRTADKPENLVGEALDRVIMSEAAKHKHETWERYIRPALSDKRGSADFVTTPEGFNWLYNMWLHGQNPDFPDFDSWRFPSWTNKVVYPGGYEDEEIQLLLRTTTPEWFLQEIGADFASFVGKIYGEFDETQHVKKVEYDPTLPNYMFFDWGFARPLAAMEVQIAKVGGQEEVRVWREHYAANRTLEEHIEIMKRREQPEGYKIDMCFGDSADPAAVMYISEHLAPCGADDAAKKNWREGVDLVKSFLRLRHDGVSFTEDDVPIMTPGYFVDYSCENHIYEMNNYRTKANLLTGQEHSAMGVANRSADHSLDAVRYGLMHIFKLGATHRLADTELARTVSGAPAPRIKPMFQYSGGLVRGREF
jgi:hypothetical protein